MLRDVCYHLAAEKFEEDNMRRLVDGQRRTSHWGNSLRQDSRPGSVLLGADLIVRLFCPAIGARVAGSLSLSFFFLSFLARQSLPVVSRIR